MHKIYSVILILLSTISAHAQKPASVEGNVDNLPVHEYNLVIDKETVNFTGKDVEAMTVNGQIPGPT